MAYTPRDAGDDAFADAIDRRGGTWTRLRLLEMDAAFCQAIRQAHPELERHEELEQCLLRTA